MFPFIQPVVLDLFTPTLILSSPFVFKTHFFPFQKTYLLVHNNRVHLEALGNLFLWLKQASSAYYLRFRVLSGMIMHLVNLRLVLDIVSCNLLLHDVITSLQREVESPRIHDFSFLQSKFIARISSFFPSSASGWALNAIITF